MIISKVHIIGTAGLKDIFIESDLIKKVDAHKDGLPSSIQMPNGSFAFPGLINSHDHLDFNLFPQLGNRIYKNYKEWGDDINKNNISAINAVLLIPQALRTQWGIYKNLLNGVTTVINHGNHLTVDNALITVFQDCYALHSTAYEKNWKWKLNDPFKINKPFVIHTGEGTDEAAGHEIDELIKANRFKKKMIAVHGVAMKPHQAKAFEALVWCPASNYFLLNATTGIGKLKTNTAILFGTDSTLSAGWNIWEHIRMAKKTTCLTDTELIDTLTFVAAGIWNLNTGAITENKNADIVIAKNKQGMTEINNFFALDPEDILLVISNGHIRLFDECLLSQMTVAGFNSITINGSVKYIEGDLPALSKKIKQYYPDAVFPFSK